MNPKQTHDTDQAIAGMRVLAAGLGAFYRELIEQGVPAEMAEGLTAEQQRFYTRPHNADEG